MNNLTSGLRLPGDLITAYLQLIQRRATRLHRTSSLPNVCILGVGHGTAILLEAECRKILDQELGQRLLDYPIVLIPFLDENHWWLLVLYPLKSRMELYAWHEQHLGAETKRIENILKELLITDPLFQSDPSGQWELSHIANLPEHKYSRDCGVLLCQTAERLAIGLRDDFNSTHTGYFRLKMFLELTNQWVLQSRTLPPHHDGWFTGDLRLYVNSLIVQLTEHSDLPKSIILKTTSECLLKAQHGYHLALIPIWVAPRPNELTGGHWMLAIADLKLRKIAYYVPTSVSQQTLVEVIQRERKIVSGMTLHFETAPATYHEMGSHCNEFVCQLAERLSHRLGAHVTKDLITEVCDEIRRDIVAGRVINSILAEKDAERSLPQNRNARVN